MLRWTRWQGISAIVTIVLGLGGGAFYLIDRFTGTPSASSLPSASPPAVPQPKPRPTCASGAICLWPREEFEGNAWTWSPGISPDGFLPDYLRDHVGSFDAQAKGCFLDTDRKREDAHPVKIGDWGAKYLDDGRFGRVVDTVRVKC
ncbi:hypothetical protein GCM10017673_47030 [Streptosporangium violaceochromogenes]|nr:hypothetical protein GCM10017673_47030 [Streptosporangium violaceochromogenes]